jgi:hypothetical protein
MTHAFMGLVASMHNALADWDDTTTIDFHRYEAVKYINKRLDLEGRSKTPVSDGVCVSVSLLVSVESFNGSLNSAKAHMMGLKKMIDLRGGIIDGFGYSTLLQRALSWADFAYATASQTALSFPFIPELASSLGVQDRFLSRSTMINTHKSSRSSSSPAIRNREVLELFEQLYSSTEAVNKFEYAKVDELLVERGQMSDSVYMIEYRLCKLEEKSRARARDGARTWSTPLFSTSTGTSDEAGDAVFEYTDPTDISDALVYASHLFVHLALRGQPPQAKRHKGLAEGLMTSLYHPLMCLGLLYDSQSTSTVGSLVASNRPASASVSASERSSIESWPSPPHESPEPSTSSISGSPSAANNDDLHGDILLWTLFMGSCVQIRSSTVADEVSADYRGFFMGVLRKYCISRGLLNSELLQEKLKGIMWLDSWCEKQLEMIWARIGYELGL